MQLAPAASVGVRLAHGVAPPGVTLNCAASLSVMVAADTATAVPLPLVTVTATVAGADWVLLFVAEKVAVTGKRVKEPNDPDFPERTGQTE